MSKYETHYKFLGRVFYEKKALKFSCGGKVLTKEREKREYKN